MLANRELDRFLSVLGNAHELERVVSFDELGESGTNYRLIVGYQHTDSIQEHPSTAFVKDNTGRLGGLRS